MRNKIGARAVMVAGMLAVAVRGTLAAELRPPAPTEEPALSATDTARPVDGGRRVERPDSAPVRGASLAPRRAPVLRPPAGLRPATNDERPDRGLYYYGH